MSAAETTSHRDVRTLYSSHHGWLHDWLRRKLGNAFDAADLAHDTFIRIIAARRALDLHTEPRALLTHIAKGLVVDHWRRQEVERAYRDAIAYLREPEVPSAETRHLILEALYRIEVMLREMPAQTREIFLAAQFEGLGYREIATRHGVSLATVKRHMRKAFLACLAAV